MGTGHVLACMPLSSCQSAVLLSCTGSLCPVPLQSVMQQWQCLKSGAYAQVGAEGKRFRPTMLLLMASSLSSVMPSSDYLTVDDRPPNVHPEEVSHSSQYCIYLSP